MLDYHKPMLLSDVVIGRGRDGKVWVKRFTRIGKAGHEVSSDYPLYQFPVETLGM